MSADARSNSIVVRDNPAAQRFELEMNAGLAATYYCWDGDLLVIVQTELPLYGREGTEKLIRGLLDEARRRKLRVIPLCWFVREFLERNPEYRDVVVPP